MKCYGCGSELPQGAKYCLSCGRKVGEKAINSEEQTLTGAREHLTKNSSGKSTRLPVVLDILLGCMAIVLVVLLYIALK